LRPDTSDAQAMSTLALAAVLGGHVMIGVLLSQWSFLAFLHAVAVVSIGWRIATSRDPELIGCVLAYVVGAEVLWRMTTDRLPWELGKYAVMGFAAIGLVRVHSLRGLVLPLLAFALLLPSAALTIVDFGMEEARQQISFNLSGPCALALAAAFFASVNPSLRRLSQILLALIAPVVSIGAVALFGILTTSDLAFNTESNFQTSGGFGPNQVSATLGLAALFCVLTLATTRAGWAYRALMFATLAWLATQSALTFSRGGLYAAVGAALAAVLCLVQDRRLRIRVLMLVALIWVVGSYMVWPRLDEFTGGTLSQRFAETDFTRRDDLGAEDLAAWNDNPVFGVGPGRSSFVHEEGIIAHTEFTRLLAEHGLFGVVWMALMLLFSAKRCLVATPGRHRAFALGMITWAALFMSNSAMRTAAPSLVFGLAFAGFERDAARRNMVTSAKTMTTGAFGPHRLTARP
jgi:O-antigen ligase